MTATANVGAMSTLIGLHFKVESDIRIKTLKLYEIT